MEYLDVHEHIDAKVLEDLKYVVNLHENDTTLIVGCIMMATCDNKQIKIRNLSIALKYMKLDLVIKWVRGFGQDYCCIPEFE